MKLVFRLAFLLALTVPAVAFAAEPQVGVEQKLRRGLYTETDLGAYFDFASVASYDGTSVLTSSNAQAYLQLSLGYDITDSFSVALQFGLGASSGVCLATVAADGTCNGQVSATGKGAADSALPDNFSNSFYQLALSYRISLIDRVAFVPGIELGYQQLSPPPFLDDNGNGKGGGFMVGADLSIEYATHMDHFFVGLDVEPRFLIGPNLTSIAIFPRVKYTF